MLRSYVRERGLLSLNEAIRKMSLMPAQNLEEFVPQIRSKGRIQVGMDADIVVFDPDTIKDNATFANANQPATGVLTLLVNGELVVHEGALVLDSDNGQRIRRTIARHSNGGIGPEVPVREDLAKVSNLHQSHRLAFVRLMGSDASNAPTVVTELNAPELRVFGDAAFARY